MNEISTPDLVALILYLKTRFQDPNTATVLDNAISELSRRTS